MINCEFDLCIYNREKKCCLAAVNISPQGVCEDCITPNFDTEALENCKAETLKRLEKKY